MPLGLLGFFTAVLIFFRFSLDSQFSLTLLRLFIYFY